MAESLESLLKEGELAVLDTSFVSVLSEHSLNDYAYMGRNGLDKLPNELIQENIERLGNIEDLAATGKLVVLREVLEEMTASLNALNFSLNYFRSSGYNKEYPEKIEGLSQYTFMKSKLIKKLGRKEFKPAFFPQNPSFIEELNKILTYSQNNFVKNLIPEARRKYEKLVFERPDIPLLRNFKNEDFQGKFVVDFYSYRAFLKATLLRAINMKLKALNSNANDRKRIKGAYSCILDTDSKIVTTAFTLSYCSPVAVFTTDLGINDLILKDVPEIIKADRDGYIKLYSLPKCPIRLIDLARNSEAAITL